MTFFQTLILILILALVGETALLVWLQQRNHEKELDNMKQMTGGDSTIQTMMEKVLNNQTLTFNQQIELAKTILAPQTLLPVPEIQTSVKEPASPALEDVFESLSPAMQLAVLREQREEMEGMGTAEPLNHRAWEATTPAPTNGSL